MVMTELWSDELFPRGVAVHAMHPGWADTIVWLAAAPEAALTSGGHWLDRERHPAAVLPGTAGSPGERRRLVEELERITGGPSAPPRVTRAKRRTVDPGVRTSIR